MLKRFSAIVVAGGAAVALMTGAAPSFATTATTFTVTPGGAVTASGSAQVKDASTGTVAKCTKVTLNATLKKGSGLKGAKIGSITGPSTAFSGCTIGTISVTVTANGFPWFLNATSYASGKTTGTITGIDLVATAPGCSATLDGTAAGAKDGKVKVTYTNSTAKLAILGTGGNLHDYAVSGCLGLINNGDAEKASGSTGVSPAQTITAP
jgi:hypothetical protein